MRKIALAVFLVLFATAATGCGGGSDSAAAADPNAPVTIPVTADVLARGREVSIANCAPCHGPLGKGDGPASATLNPKPRDHSNRVYMDELADQKIADTVRMGGLISGYPNMPSSPHIKGDDMAALVAYVRSLSRGAANVASVELKLQS